MARLKSLTNFPPYEFQSINPVFGMARPDRGSFAAVCQKEYARRKANKYLCEKHGLGMDMASVEYDVEQQNVARCQAHGWHDFIASEAPAPTFHMDASKKNTLLGNAVGGVKRVAAGVGLLIEWVGESGKVVEKPLAEQRAEVCTICPKNGKGGFTDYFTVPAAERIKKQLEIKNDLQLQTSRDEDLRVCEACLCPLKLKVWTPLGHILKHMKEDVKKELHSKCWITAEEKQNAK